jgi:hypothetical protein
MAKKKMHIVTILFRNEKTEWDYEPNTTLQIPVMAINEGWAFSKVEDLYCGSEYPDYTIISVEKCDDFLFMPIL